MSKKEFGPQPWLFPNPTVLVGTVVNGKANIAPYAWCGITGAEPPTLAIGIRHERYTLKGIYENMAFSVNIPSVDSIAETDYCGMTTGAKTDKIAACGFKVFYGNQENAPLIEECPVNLECEVMHLLNIGIHMLVIGKITNAHMNKDCLTEGQPDIMKIRPFVYSRGPSARYNAIGEVLGKAYDIGKTLKKLTTRGM